MLVIRGLSQNEFAEKMGKDHAQISRWVNGKTIPHKKTLAHIGKVIKCDIYQKDGTWNLELVPEVLLDDLEARINEEGADYTSQAGLIEYLQGRLVSLSKELSEISGLIGKLKGD